MQTTEKLQDVQVSTVETPAGDTFKIAMTRSSNIDAILDMTLDPDNDVFEVREVNIGNEDFRMAFGRTNSAR
jgi:hypothetical protein